MNCSKEHAPISNKSKNKIKGRMIMGWLQNHHRILSLLLHLPPFSILLPHSFVPCLRDRVVRGSVVVVVRVVTVVVIVLCCCCFFLLLLLRGNLSFFFCCCCLFVVVSACSPYWLCFSWCSLRLSSPLLAFSACVHCVFLGVLRKWGIRIINPYGLYGLLIRMDHTDS